MKKRKKNGNRTTEATEEEISPIEKFFSKQEVLRALCGVNLQ